MIKGIDVYSLNGVIDWKRVAASGVKFAMIKASQGRGETPATKKLRNFRDGAFTRNITGAASAGIQCGVWHWLTATTVHEAKVEADYFISVIKPYKDKITLWAAVDVESETYLPRQKAMLTKIVKAFMERVEAAGFKPMLYTNPNYIINRYTAGAFNDAEIWLAHYGVTKPYAMPKLRIWQMKSVGTESDVANGWATSDEGRIPGINAACDVNAGFFEVEDMPVSKPDVDGYKVGEKYEVKPGDRYTNGASVPARLAGRSYTIMQVQPGRVLLGEIASWVRV